MIECIFTIDYEIYGDGSGALNDLVYEPAEKLKSIFRKWDAPFVVFVEAAELEIIEANGTDPAIEAVKRQVREFYQEGIEIALHLHPQWYNARFQDANWILDYGEYNLCTLKRERIQHIICRALDYLRVLVGNPGFTPLSFRAGNWLFQPTKTAAEVLVKNGVRIDSSVFKGGLQRNHRLDYRSSRENGYFWPFKRDVNIPDTHGALIEIPIYTVMVPCWKMLTAKRVCLQRKGYSAARSPRQNLNRFLDLLRPWYPLKLDFCRMTLHELTSVTDRVIRDNQRHPETYKPVVLIGHTKDLVDLETIDTFLAHLRDSKVRVTKFESVIEACGLSTPVSAL